MEYSFMKKGFDLTEEYREFNFPVGMYNYYREKYPELHPVYKPFMFFFRNGDVSKGLRQLERSVKENVFTKPEAGMFLVHIYLYYENNPAAALKIIQQVKRFSSEVITKKIVSVYEAVVSKKPLPADLFPNKS